MPADSAPPLSGPQSAFLKMLGWAEQIGIGGTAVKLYNDVIQRGRTAPITEQDVSPTERQQFRDLVLAKAAATGQNSGKIDYPDYQKYQPSLDSNILGGFRYSVDPSGGVGIKDSYDFNVNRAGPDIENNPIIQSLGIVANPRGLAAQIGRAVKPDTGGGIPVQMNFPAPVLGLQQ